MISQWLSLVLILLPVQTASFTFTLPITNVSTAWQRGKVALFQSRGGDEESSPEDGRRRFMFQTMIRSVALTTLLSGTAVEGANAAADEGKTVWLTGKAPRVPGEKPRDKNDVKGTRKDPNFLRSIADCKNKCENTVGPDGLARSKEDCLSECQDICCTTYEQCTFGIVPRI